MKSTEVFAAKTTDLKDGEMKEITINDTKILLAKTNGRFYAVGATCPHYNAPLIKGALCGTKLYCPWHHSVFDITTGALCEPPALDGLPHYETTIKEDNIYIQFGAKTNDTGNGILKSNNEKTSVVLGGGAAGLMAVQTLRSEGFDGRIVVITKENDLPYDRPALSKKYMSGKEKEEQLPLRKEDFFDKNAIEVERNREVKKVHVKNKSILFADGSLMAYDTLLVATGGEPQTLAVKGAQLPNVFTLRSAADAGKILNQAKKSKCVCIVGASFIAMETAASLKTLGLNVTVIAKEKLPFEKKFGDAIGKMFYNLHTQKGVVIKTEAEVKQIEGTEKAEAVVLQNGERIPTDMVIVGIGVHPNTGFIDGIQLNEKDKSIRVDEHLQAADGLFAAGDIARFTNAKNGGKTNRIEHWRVALQQGRIAALNMMGKPHSMDEVVPFFWTNQFEKRLSYVGHVEDWDDIILDGSVDE
ncbi:MAG: FAD-dependent oxidoreductase, partial [Bacteroidota bacterium]|nr:FAD-dependent oxidoreductase [Bacteroidota bacterium]